VRALLPLAALLAAGCVGCVLRIPSGLPPEPPALEPADPPFSSQLVWFEVEGERRWGDPPPSWVRTAADAAAGLVDERRASGPELRLRIRRTSEVSVASVVAHVATVLLFPRLTDVHLQVTAVAVGADAEAVASAESGARVEEAASLGLLLYPPAWPDYALGGSHHDHPAFLAALDGAVRAALADLVRRVDPAPAPEPEPSEPSASCPACAAPVEPGWVACPHCAVPLDGR